MIFGSDFPIFPQLQSQDVLIWIFKINDLMNYCETMVSLLSNEEKFRSKAFDFKTDSQRYICAHGMLRIILANYTNSNPVSLNLVSDLNRKPQLAFFDDIKFNLSHTKELIALAISMHREVGIDIEKCVPLSNMDDMSRSIMHTNELSDYLSLPKYKRTDYFYRCWVKKESIVKGWGTGLYEDLRKIRVMDITSTNISPKKFSANYYHKNDWYIEDFYPAINHFGAVSYQGNYVDIKIITKTTI